MAKQGLKGVMKTKVKTDKGFTLTNEKGFTIEEEDGKVLGFDVVDHPELGTALLFGNQIFALKYWDDEDLEKGLRVFSNAISMEIERRKTREAGKTTQ